MTINEAVQPRDPYEEQQVQLQEQLDAFLASPDASEHEARFRPNIMRQVGVVWQNPEGRTEDRTLSIALTLEGQPTDEPMELRRTDDWASAFVLDPHNPGQVMRRWAGHNTRTAPLELEGLTDLNTQLATARTYNLDKEKVVNGSVVPKSKIRALGRMLLGRN